METYSQPFQLYVYEGDYGVPSFDTESTKCILYSKIAKVPVTINLLNSRKNCALYSAPTLIHNHKKLYTFQDIMTYLQRHNYNINCGLSAKQASEEIALENMVKSKLDTALLYFLWLEPGNADGFTNLWHMKALPFPFNFMHLKRRRVDIEGLVEVLYPKADNMDVVRADLIAATTQCLSSLSAKLGTKDYFYGDSPCSLDVIVYSYLAPMIKFPLPANALSNLLTMWPNLINFVKHIDAKYFRDLSVKPKYLPPPQVKIKQPDEDFSYSALFVLIVGASTMMFCYAMNKGIVKFTPY